jgi:DNA-directed RNA polymerase specialized sigma24 family protein
VQAGSGQSSVSDGVIGLGHVWPDVGERLFRLLRSRGVDRPTTEDIVQETAARVLERAVPFDSSDDLFRWAAVVGWRLAVDNHRQQNRLIEKNPPESPSPADVQREVENRLRLADLGAELAKLSATDQETLRSALDPASFENRKEAIKHSVRLHRARNRLRKRLEEWGPLSLGGWLRRTLTLRRSANKAVALGSAVSIVGAALVVGPSLLSPTPRRAQGDSVATAEVGPEHLVELSGEAAGPAPMAAPRLGGNNPRPAGSAAVQPLLPPARARLMLGTSTPVWVKERSKRPGDHLLCAYVLGGGDRCIDAVRVPYPQLP